jgi:hypothetical protein
LSFQAWDSFVRLAKEPDFEYSILMGNRVRLLEEIARQKTRRGRLGEGNRLKRVFE